MRPVWMLMMTYEQGDVVLVWFPDSNLLTTETGKQTGLISDSVIMTDNIATVRLSEIYKRIGTFTEMDALKESLRHTFGI